MLSVAADKVLGMGEQNWWYNSSTYGPHLCMSRAFAKTYLNIDGTVYDEKNSDGTYKTFVEETTDRDQSSIRPSVATTTLERTVMGTMSTPRPISPATL
jgi:hypothetical protein